MALLFGPRRRQLNPVTRAVILVGLFTGWICMSNIRTLVSAKAGEEDSYKGRSLMSHPVEDVETVTVTETIVTKDNGSQVSEPGAKTDNKTNCIPPAVTQFPDPVMGNKVRRHGGLILHILVATYMFIGLAIVCDDYFVPSLNKVSDVMNLSPDVAGATFMAAGSSAPELATAIIGVFVAKDDIGVSGVIGSAVFNITLVIAVCALAAEHAIYLNWYPVCRDCFCYLISILALLCAISNEVVSWPESLGFLILYFLYCVFMAFNKTFSGWAQRMPVPQSWRGAEGEAGRPTDAAGNFEKWDGAENGNAFQPNGTSKDMEMKYKDGTTEVRLTPQDEVKEVKDEEIEDPLKKPLPLDVTKWQMFSWYIMFPLNALAVYTIPDCRKKKHSRLFVLSFLISIAWISLYSYLMVWMITVIGFTLGIPDTVMGLTFIAAGVSVPDALSGIAVVKEGHGDMAVSNAIGSNVFDILVCLGVPWFIKTAIQDPGSTVPVTNKGLLYSTITLFSTVVGLIFISHMNGWKMDRKYGIILLIWYFIVMLFATLYETNIFGDFVIPECPTNY